LTIAISGYPAALGMQVVWLRHKHLARRLMREAGG